MFASHLVEYLISMNARSLDLMFHVTRLYFIYTGYLVLARATLLSAWLPPDGKSWQKNLEDCKWFFGPFSNFTCTATLFALMKQMSSFLAS